MMQALTDSELINLARERFPQIEAGPQTTLCRSIIHELCDRLETRNKPTVMTWEGVWGQFDKEKRNAGAASTHDGA